MSKNYFEHSNLWITLGAAANLRNNLLVFSHFIIIYLFLHFFVFVFVSLLSGLSAESPYIFFGCRARERSLVHVCRFALFRLHLFLHDFELVMFRFFYLLLPPPLPLLSMAMSMPMPTSMYSCALFFFVYSFVHLFAHLFLLLHIYLFRSVWVVRTRDASAASILSDGFNRVRCVQDSKQIL